LTFTAYRGLSYTSEIAFDDIHMRPGLCPDKPADATPPPPTRPPTPQPWSKTIPQVTDPMITREYHPFYDSKSVMGMGSAVEPPLATIPTACTEPQRLGLLRFRAWG